MEKERKIISVEGFVYGNAVSLTWIFESKQEDAEEDYDAEDQDEDDESNDGGEYI